jgi:predicted Zn-dependent peptidase
VTAGFRRPALLLLLLLLAGAAGHASAEVARRELPSGLTVLAQEHRELPLVAASLVVRAGPRFEGEDEAGLTNLLQQVMLKGTTTRSALDMAEAAERMGGSLGSSTEPDFAELRGTALARHWRALLELLADVALRPALLVPEIDTERRAILSGIRSRRDQPFPRAFDTMMSSLYGPHPYAKPALGRPATVERADREVLLAHHHRHYRAPRMIVSVSGDVPAADAIAEVARLFADAPGAPAPPEAVPGAPGPSGGRAVVPHPAAQSQVLIGFLAPPVGHPDYPAMKVLASALGGGMSSRLFTELRDRRGLAYSTGASYPSRVGPSYLLAQLGTAPANAARAEEGMRAEIEQIRREGIADLDLRRAKAYLLGQFTMDRRTNARLAWYAAFFEVMGVGQGFPAAYRRAVERVTPDDVRRVAGAYLASPTIVRVGPAAD